ncbi:uncharacterized protein LOC132925150 [Rhopalosiphum padi]|uniref:uncharacterized protein LOC132925150 n=1 Tax=Rhopalosiphum padi TaxID=40932 RepID=UPI00298D7DE4|nr:uncharacterized protein LOC132925150 [Rhopalosiphum padi]
MNKLSNKLSNEKLVLSDKKKSKNGKGTAPKKVYRKIVKKQTEVVGELSTTVENVHPVQVKPKVQHKELSATKGTVKKSIRQSAVKKSLAQKVLALTTEQTPINHPKSRPIKIRPKEPNSSTINKTEPKRSKLVKRILKATPTTSKTTTTIVMPIVSAGASHKLG